MMRKFYLNPESELAQRFWEDGKVADCPIYDMHGHMGIDGSLFFPNITPEKMLKLMDRAGVRKLCFSHHLALHAPGFSDVRTCELIRPFGDRFGFYAAINPNAPQQYRPILEAYDSFRPWIVGLKCLADYHHVPMDSPLYDEAFRFAVERDLPVLLHTWGGSRYNAPERVRPVLERHPGLRLIFGHCFRPELEKAVALARDYPRTYLELTSIPGYSAIVEYLCGEVGSGRILFGTDLPWFDEHQAIGGILGAGISDEERRDIFYRNARKLLGITEPSLP